MANLEGFLWLIFLCVGIVASCMTYIVLLYVSNRHEFKRGKKRKKEKHPESEEFIVIDID